MGRLVFLAFWLWVTGRPIWRALEAGEPQRAVVPAVLLVVGVWGSLRTWSRRRDRDYGPAGDDDPYAPPAWERELFEERGDDA